MEPGRLAAKDDGRLWAIAAGLSLMANAALLALLGFATIRSQRMQAQTPPPAPRQDTVVTILPPENLVTAPSPATPAVAAAEPPAPSPPAVPTQPRFARTSTDQTEEAPKTSPFIGERNTVATSDRPPVAGAPDMPSQKGAPPRDAGDFETTESRYQDGSLSGSGRKADSQATPEPPAPPSPPTPVPADPVMAAKPAAADGKADKPAEEEVKPASRPMENLLTGPDPVDVPVPKPEEKNELKPTPPRPAQEAAKAGSKPQETPRPPAAKAIDDPMFRGAQRKTAIVGSISRTGRSALNVTDTPLGRYQAAISRAVELEWQRNCVRHRDFITPGYLTVRFFVEPTGKVRTVQFVGQMETGEVQKGFTLNSIRDAEIPPMPAALKKEYTREPLELIFNFYF